MDSHATEARIESAFRKQVRKDSRVRNAFLLVDSEKLNIHLNIAEGNTGIQAAHPAQPVHLASVGKLFTATLISMLHEQGKLGFEDPIHQHLDRELMKGLHIYKGKEYSELITIRHLLMQTSGLNDVFYDLWKKLQAEPGWSITPYEAVTWGKKHLKPVAVPGKKLFYTDTNYYLLGLIVENITGSKFHEVMHQMVFKPLGMKHAFMYGFSHPEEPSELPMAGLYIKGVDFRSVKGVHQIDYAGGSVTAPLEEFLLFMKALVNHQLIRQQTLERMIRDHIPMGFPTLGFNYGYSIWKLRTIPILAPKEYFAWGCVGVTGAFMFYHPLTESFIIGSFGDFAYRGKALGFMARKVIRELVKG